MSQEMCMNKALISAALMVSAAFAHHGSGAYNTKQPVTVEGTVTDFQFVNPHVLIVLETKGESGPSQKWQGELTSPNHLVRYGWKKSSIKTGDNVAITGWRVLTGANSLWITKVVVNG